MDVNNFDLKSKSPKFHLSIMSKLYIIPLVFQILCIGPLEDTLRVWRHFVHLRTLILYPSHSIYACLLYQKIAAVIIVTLYGCIRFSTYLKYSEEIEERSELPSWRRMMNRSFKLLPIYLFVILFCYFLSFTHDCLPF